MSNSIQLKQAISQHIQGFSNQPLRQAALSLFATLGYESDRTVETPSVAEFRAQFDSESKLEHPAALIASWKSAELLFQLTDEELSRSTALFKDEAVKTSLLQSYVFIAIELDDGDYARGKLAGIARQINRIFPMPVMVLFKIGGQLSIAVINRRLNKRDDNKDVLGKVTLIQNIAIDNPHPGHLDILASFSLAELTEGRRVIQNFDQLHAAWEEVFNVELLNKRFYRELANWYFWALPQVDFPDDIEKDDEKRRATGLIRLLTRLIFCWFLKEKNLVPEKLFAEDELKKILKDLSPNASTYNEAILQNLFFATLNQRMGKDAKGQPYRAFAKDEGFQKNRTTYGVDTLYRYEDHFRDPATALDHFADVPFLNGGLFECLDRTEEATGKKRYLDGFSRTKSKRPTLPNHLFFSAEHEADLSDAYGDKKRKKEKVRGLLHILNAYKFTIVENTPVDQEIALDPELLGKVFENLLASYNEETKTTARKQTGSFYTPRPIVDYMVDESLKAHLTGALVKVGMSEQDAKTGLDILFAYTERAHPFSEKETATLLDAIHTCKILDPACGSGAFPMGMLHKLVYIIHKLDPDNARWKQLQIDAAAKIPDSSARGAAIEAIERDFAENEDDYGRKLYLIENCLYGVDIQPIAIQISKLRFFISLICDQRTNRNKRENHGIRPLPNLETKFVAADTLIGLPEMDQLELLPGRVMEIEEEIENLYHRHFGVQRRDQKLALQKKIKGLREELGKLLAESLGSSKKAQHIAEWNPFDPQEVAGFFDPLWTFGRSMSAGCDIVIGNPPYVFARNSKAKGMTAEQKAYFYKNYSLSEYQINLYPLFIEAGARFLQPTGILSFITPNNWLTLNTNKKLRRFVLEKSNITLVNFYKRAFESADVDSAIVIFKNSRPTTDEPVRIAEWEEQYSDLGEILQSKFLSKDDCVINIEAVKGDEVFTLIEKIENNAVPLAEIANAKVGLKAYQTGKGKPPQTEEMKKNRVFHSNIGGDGYIRYLEGRDVCRYAIGWSGEYLKYGSHLAEPRGDFGIFSTPRILVRQIPSPLPYCINACFTAETLLNDLNSMNIVRIKVSPKALLAVLNSRVVSWWFAHKFGKLQRGIFPQFKINELAQFPIAKTLSKHEAELTSLVSCIMSAKNLDETAIANFIDNLVDVSVFELYFHDHMAERDLLFLDDLAPYLAAYNPDAPESQQRDFIAQLYRTLNAPTSIIRNRLLRISADSPDLLAVILAEGKA